MRTRSDPQGASEAIAAEKPLIVSLNQATKSHLNKGTILINNTTEEITRSITQPVKLIVVKSDKIIDARQVTKASMIFYS